MGVANQGLGREYFGGLDGVRDLCIGLFCGEEMMCSIEGSDFLSGSRTPTCLGGGGGGGDVHRVTCGKWKGRV